ncbi:MAG: hypothetical protein OES57_09655 [Acidimicrobiia bacterium]|nr:hypothetical protein [Acidimicrobiia bacterium]
MAAPQFVPNSTRRSDKAYVSPPRRAGSWTAARPGDVVGEGSQPRGEALGNQGPDQGYALTLARRELTKARLAENEHADDVVEGVAGLATRRASLFGRAPMIHDVRLAFEVYGLYEDPGPELAEWRRRAFAGLGHGPAHYLEARALAEAVPEPVVRGTPDAAAEARRVDWRATVGVPAE